MKTKYTHRIIALLGAVMLFINLSAQSVKAKKDKCNGFMYNTQMYIFEGKADSSKLYSVKTGDKTFINYYCYLVEVLKVIKGNIQKGTVEIIENAPGGVSKWRNGMYVESGPVADAQYGVPGHGLYFCYDKAAYITDSYYKNTNAKTLQLEDGIPIDDGVIRKEPKGYGLGNYFTSLKEFYDFLRKNYGVKIEE
jgi:hypothetical protein